MEEKTDRNVSKAYYILLNCLKARENTVCSSCGYDTNTLSCRPQKTKILQRSEERASCVQHGMIQIARLLQNDLILVMKCLSRSNK